MTEPTEPTEPNELTDWLTLRYTGPQFYPDVVCIGVSHFEKQLGGHGSSFGSGVACLVWLVFGDKRMSTKYIYYFNILFMLFLVSNTIGIVKFSHRKALFSGQPIAIQSTHEYIYMY